MELRIIMVITIIMIMIIIIIIIIVMLYIIISIIIVEAIHIKNSSYFHHSWLDQPQLACIHSLVLVEDGMLEDRREKW